MEKVFLGARAGRLLPGLEALPITKVELLDSDGELLAQAGTDEGRTVTATQPDATQAMADSILEKLSGYRYQPYEAQEAMLDPASELGDGVTVGGMYSVLAKTAHSFGPLHLADISAPAADETEDECPYKNTVERAIAKSAKTTRSLITKTAEEIRLEVLNEVEGLSASFTVELGKISARVEDAEDSVEVAVTTLDGLTVKDSAGEVKVKGGMVTADGLHVNAANIDGTLTADQIELTGSISWPDLAADAQNQITSAQNMSQSAYNLAYSASGNASSALDNLQLLANGQYQDGTFINGKNIYAPNLYGDTISLMDGYSRLVGTISLQQSATYAMDFSSNLSLRMQAAYGYNVYLSNNDAWLQMVGGNLTLSGNLLVSGHNFGTSLPSGGTYGQVFFLLGG